MLELCTLVVVWCSFSALRHVEVHGTYHRFALNTGVVLTLLSGLAGVNLG